MPVDQATTARWMGYEGDDAVDQMNRDHDPLHHNAAMLLGVPSYAMLDAQGKELSHEEKTLANLEEDAILLLQKYWQHARRHRDG